jgi:hypothetical protein
MVRVILIVIYLISLAITTLMCGIAVIVISLALVMGKLTDLDVWYSAPLIAVTGCLFWLLSRLMRDLTERDL